MVTCAYVSRSGVCNLFGKALQPEGSCLWPHVLSSVFDPSSQESKTRKLSDVSPAIWT